MTLAQFRVRFPEFQRAGDELVNDVLEHAGELATQAVYGDDTTEAVGYQAAYLLSLSPFGRGARSTSQTSLYREHLMRLRKRRTPRAMVTGAQFRREVL